MIVQYFVNIHLPMQKVIVERKKIIQINVSYDTNIFTQ